MQIVKLTLKKINEHGIVVPREIEKAIIPEILKVFQKDAGNTIQNS